MGSGGPGGHEPAACWAGQGLPVGQGKGVFPSAQHWGDTSRVLGSISGFPVQDRHGHAGLSQPTNQPSEEMVWRTRCQALLGSAVGRATIHKRHKLELEKLSLDTRGKSFTASLVKQK